MLTSPVRPAEHLEADDLRTVEDAYRAGSPARAPQRVAVRQRQVVMALSSVSLLAATAAVVTSAGLLWLVVVLGVALTAGYLMLLARVRSAAVQREMSLAFRPAGELDGSTWGSLDRALYLAPDGGEAELAGSPQQAGVALFLAAQLLGWFLTPIVAIIRLACGDLSDLRRSGILDRVVRAQQYGRSQSLRVLTVSVAATAGVAGVAGAGMATASAASAAPAVAASFRLSAGPAAATSRYTVRSGDTLSAIAARYGMAMTTLASMNHIADANVITVGQVLTVTGTGTASGLSGSGTYTVQSGDTLNSIAARYGMAMPTLAAANHIADPNVITVGQVLQVGGGGSVAASSTASSSYTVQPGDTLSAIAARFGTTVATLASENGIDDPNAISVGQVIHFGGPVPAAATAPVRSPAPVAAPVRSTPVAAPAQSAPAASGAQVAVATALAQVGKPYSWGGSGPSSFDCSGLVMYAWAAAGKSLPHYTVSQLQDTTRISESELQPGDLVFYGGDQPGHVTMYIGNGQIVTADHSGTPVRVETITWDGTPTGFGRVA